MKKKTILILGAKSDIGLATAYLFAKFRYNIQLAARNINNLKTTSSDISIRYNVNSSLYEFDINKKNLYGKFLNSLSVTPDIVLNTIGYMGVQKNNEKNAHDASLVFQSNYEGPSLIFSEFANLFEKRGYGTLIGVSSVAGERGRASNYIYGSAKAAYTVYLSGLRNRLAKKNVQVITVLPGFVDTKMTAGMNLPKKLLAKPEEVARAIFSAYNENKDIVYVKPIWKYIMLVVKIIPEKIFKYLNI
jgi:short-subunit dehydrogenase